MCLIPGWLCSSPGEKKKKKSLEWVLYWEQMLPSHVLLNVSSYGVIFLFSAWGGGTELSSVWCGCSKTVRGLAKETGTAMALFGVKLGLRQP